MKKYLVGGYYDNRIFEGIDVKTPFGKDIGIYDLEEALKLELLDSVIEDYNNIYKSDDDVEWDKLNESEKIEFIEWYTEGDEIAGLVAFETLEEAVKYVKNVLKEINELEEEYEYSYSEEDNYGRYHQVYEEKEKRDATIQVSKAGGNASKNSLNWRVAIPNTWIYELEITQEDREVELILDKKERKIIIKREY